MSIGGPGDAKVAGLVRLLDAARRGGPKVPVSVGAGLSRAEAFDVQERMAAIHGPVGGFKVACPPGAPIVMAPIYQADIAGPGSRIEVPGGDAAGIELEFAFRLKTALPNPDAPDFAARLRGAIELLPAIEIVHSRLIDPGSADANLKMADNQVNGAVVLGQAVSDWRDIDVTRARGGLTAGAAVLLDGEGAVPGGDAFETLKRFALSVGDHCGGWQPDQVVITGSLNGLPWVKPGLDVEGRIEGVGDVRFRLERA